MVIINWYNEIIAPRIRSGAISARYSGAVKLAMPMATPRTSRPTISTSGAQAAPHSTEPPTNSIRAEDQRALAAERGRHPGSAQRTDRGTGHHDADDPLDYAVGDLKILLDEFLRPGNHADIQTEHQPCQRGKNTGEYGSGLGVRCRRSLG